MTTTPTTSSAAVGANGRPRPAAPPSASTALPDPPKLRRRPIVALAATGLIALGGLGGVWVWLSAADTVEVVATRAPVARGQELRAEDLMLVRVNPDPNLRVVPAQELSSLVGDRATTDLVAGTLVAPEQVTEVLPPASGQSVVGVAPEVGFMPAEELRPGDQVRIVQTPGAQGEVSESPIALSAEVLAVRVVGDRTVVDVLVPAAQAPELAARAATGKVAVVLDARER